MTAEPVERMLPLYEAKMIHHFDHRWATYDSTGGTRDLTVAEKQDAEVTVLPRYWIAESEANAVWPQPTHSWQAAWRGIARATDARSAIAALAPAWPGGGNFDMLLAASARSAALLISTLNSVAFDYVTRQKLTGMHLQFSVVRQLPVLPPAAYDVPAPWASEASLSDWVVDRVLELVYTAWDLEPFALDLYDDGPPFRWDEQRRAQLRSELDAAYFHLYGLDRDDTAYVLDTFPIVRRKDEAAHGEYRTKRLVLEAYDALAEAARAGTTYVSPLDPSPGDGPRHPAREDVA
jgi:hypothetical protein